MGLISHAASAFAATLALALAPTSFAQSPEPAAEMAAKYAPRMDAAVRAGATDPTAGLTDLGACVRAWNEGTAGLATWMLTSFHNEMVRSRISTYANDALLPEWNEAEVDHSVARLRAVTEQCQPYFAAGGEKMFDRADVRQHTDDIADTQRLIFASAVRYTIAMSAHQAAGGTVTSAFCQAGGRLSRGMMGIVSSSGDEVKFQTLTRFAEVGAKLCPAPAAGG
jgi:hypothetical protein